MRPRFFCGQLLTDEDLSTMVRWTDSKFRLQRHRDGWGIACGLDVRCDPDNPQGVLVSEGYAVSCCGEDIVVCRDEGLDLSEACRDDEPCTDPEASIGAAEAETRRQQEWDELIEEIGQEKLEEEQAKAAMEALKRRLERERAEEDEQSVSVRWVDIYVEYAERDTDPKATLHHSDCAEAPDCEPTKVEETYRIGWRRGGPVDPDQHETDQWCRRYDACLDVLRRFVKEVGHGRENVDRLREWLIEWIERHPPTVFCELRDLICELSDDELARRYLEILGRLALDCRIAHTRESCHACRQEEGVPLARVYLGQVVPNRPCRVISIDAFRPFRRPLSPVTAPAPIGAVNVGSLIGARWEEACRHLADLGVRARRSELDGIDHPGELLSRLDCGCGPIIECGDNVTVLVARSGQAWMHDARVVGFCRGSHQSTPAQDELDDERPERERREVIDEHHHEERPMTDEEIEHECNVLKKAEGVGERTAQRIVVEQGMTLERIAHSSYSEVESAVKEALNPGWRGQAPAMARAIIELAREELAP